MILTFLILLFLIILGGILWFLCNFAYHRTLYSIEVALHEAIHGEKNTNYGTAEPRVLEYVRKWIKTHVTENSVVSDIRITRK